MEEAFRIEGYAIVSSDGMIADANCMMPNSLKFDADQPYQVHDLLSGQRYVWRGPRNYVMLDPQRAPAHVFRLRRRVRSEQDFDYYL